MKKSKNMLTAMLMAGALATQINASYAQRTFL